MSSSSSYATATSDALSILASLALRSTRGTGSPWLIVQAGYPFVDLGFRADALLAAKAPQIDPGPASFFGNFKQTIGSRREALLPNIELAAITGARPSGILTIAGDIEEGKYHLTGADRLPRLVFIPSQTDQTQTLTRFILMGDDDIIESFVADSYFKREDEPSDLGYWFQRGADDDEGSPSSSRPSFTIVPRRLVHDGAYPAEGEESYSWSWGGPDPHLRLFLGCGLQGLTRADVVVVSTNSPADFDSLVVAVNGSVALHRTERWSPNSGRVLVEFEADPATPTVLSLVVPHAVENHGRNLSICLGDVQVGPA